GAQHDSIDAGAPRAQGSGRAAQARPRLRILCAAVALGVDGGDAHRAARCDSGQRCERDGRDLRRPDRARGRGLPRRARGARARAPPRAQTGAAMSGWLAELALILLAWGLFAVISSAALSLGWPALRAVFRRCAPVPRARALLATALAPIAVPWA